MFEQMVADVMLKVNGVPLLPAVRRDLIDVSIRDDLDMASTFSIKLHSWDLDLQKVTWIDNGLFGLGATVDILMGYVDGAMVPVISGEIADLEAEFDATRNPVLTVTGYDFRQRLARSVNDKPYGMRRDSDIALEIIARNHLPPIVVPTAEPLVQVTQENESDLAFLQKRARLNGYEVLMLGPAVYFGPPVPSPAPLLELGGNLMTFSPTVSGSSLVNNVEVVVVDLTRVDEQVLVATSTVTRFPGTIPGVDRLDRLSPRTQKVIVGPNELAEGRKMADAEVKELAGRTLSASGRCRGNGSLRAGQIVVIAGVGVRFSGPYRLTSVSHSFSQDSGFVTNFSGVGIV
jgi:phage protein D